jgi:hypothetical protein
VKRLVAFALYVAGSIVAGACVQNERSDLVFFPDKEEFINGGVSAMMESRCGGLDCHGQVGRPLRLYSQRGLRFATPQEDTKLRDDRPTTPEERRENYQSVIGLEPEGLGDTLASDGVYVNHQLLLKPLDDASGVGVRHKGGPVLQANPNDPGWACLHGWARGKPNRQACTAATF